LVHRGSLLQGEGAALRKAKARRTLEALFEATAQALRAVSADDARGYFEHCGYEMTQAHPL
jgi:hypothetical protein